MPLSWPEAQHIYLSPRLDDVILSCAGTIAQQTARGESVAVITVFAASPPPNARRSPFAKALHERWQKSFESPSQKLDINAVRRGEDILAFGSISADIDVVHYILPDCIYRVNPSTGAPLYPTEEAVFGEVDPADPALVALSSVPPLPQGAILYVPLAVGGHVDHIIMRQQAEGWGIPLTYYEDYPYVATKGALEQALGDTTGWEPLVVPMDTRTIHLKRDAVLQYVSQISSFWKGSSELSDALYAQIDRAGGERFWVRSTEEVPSQL